MIHHQARDVIYVKEFLDLEGIDTTLLYIQLAEAIFKETNDEFAVRVASTKEEIIQLKLASNTYAKRKAFYT